MPDGVLYLSKSNAIDWVNPRRKHFGLDHGRDIGAPGDQSGAASGLRSISGRKLHLEPLLMRSRETRVMPWSCRSFPYAEDRKWCCRDVTWHQTPSETVRRDFVASVSHELRTPLTVVISFSEILEDGVNEPVSRREAEVSEHGKRPRRRGCNA